MKKIFTSNLKKLNIGLILIALTLALGINSCKKDNSNEQPAAEIIASVQGWFSLKTENLSLTTALFRKNSTNKVSSTKASQSGPKMADHALLVAWDDAMTYKKGDSTIIEVPVTSPGIFKFDTKARISGEKISMNKSFTRLLFIRTIAKTEGYFMTIISSDSYLSNTSSDPKKNTFLKKEPNFSGTIVYHDLSGNMTNAITIGNLPSPVKLASLKSPGDNRISSAFPESCQETDIYEVIGVGCTDVSANFTYCESVYSVYVGHTICGGGNGPTNPGGNTGGTGGNNNDNQREIKLDTSITNNPKLYCLLKKLLGQDGTTGNAEMKALLEAFNSQGFDITFKIGTMIDPNSKGETSPDPYNSTKYNIVLNSTKINSETQMSWVKTILHEAFHANLIQKAYQVFGNTAINLWETKPENMTFHQLIDYIEMKAIAGNYPFFPIEHHAYMAENFEAIKDGLKSFSLANNTNHTNFADEHFSALAYEGLNGTSYYLNKVLKDVNSNDKMGTYKGNVVTLAQAHYYNSIDFQTESNIPCN